MNEQNHLSEHWSKIEALIQIAFEKGLDKAIQEARKVLEPHLLDDFHDLLVDRFREELIQKGKLKEQ